MQSLTGGSTLFYPSTATHDSKPLNERVEKPQSRNAGNKENAPLHDRNDQDRSARPSYIPLPPRDHLDAPSQSPLPSSPLISPRSRHSYAHSIDTNVPTSPSLPTISPDAPASRSIQTKLRPSGLWGDLSDVKFMQTQEFWLVLYFVFNLSLTLYNKGVLVQFPFPYTLTALHALCGAIGGWSLWAQGAFVPKRLSAADNLALVTFSVLYAMNIAVSNVSLNLVTVPVSTQSPGFSSCSDRNSVSSSRPSCNSDLYPCFVKHDVRDMVQFPQTIYADSCYGWSWLCVSVRVESGESTN